MSSNYYNLTMKTLTIGNLKAQFSRVIEDIKHGEEITIAYGKKCEKLAVIVPISKFKTKKRKVGILKNKASFKLKNFKITDEELLSL